MDNNFNGQNNLNNISPIEPVGQPLFVDVSTEQSPIPSTSETLSLDNQNIKVTEIKNVKKTGKYHKLIDYIQMLVDFSNWL